MVKVEEKKISTYISLLPQHYKIIKEGGINLSLFVGECIEKEYINKQKRKEILKEKIEKIQEEIKEIEKSIEEDNKEREEYVKNLSERQLKEIKDSVEIVKIRGEDYFKGRYDRYKTLFEENISKEKFKWILDKFKDN